MTNRIADRLRVSFDGQGCEIVKEPEYRDEPVELTLHEIVREMASRSLQSLDTFSVREAFRHFASGLKRERETQPIASAIHDALGSVRTEKRPVLYGKHIGELKSIVTGTEVSARDGIKVGVGAQAASASCNCGRRVFASHGEESTCPCGDTTISLKDPDARGVTVTRQTGLLETRTFSGGPAPIGFNDEYRGLVKSAAKLCEKALHEKTPVSSPGEIEPWMTDWSDHARQCIVENCRVYGAFPFFSPRHGSDYWIARGELMYKELSPEDQAYIRLIASADGQPLPEVE